MIKIKGLFSSGLFSILLIQGAFADDSPSKLSPLKVFANWEVSEIESFTSDPGTTYSAYPRALSTASSVWLLEEAKLSDNTKVFVGVGGLYFFILPSKGNQYSVGQRSGFGFTDLHAEFEFWSRGQGNHGLLLKAGVFPFKYNENAKNLGEYMFRTYTYPTAIFTGGLTKVNSAGVQLNGFDLNTKLGGFNNDFLLTLKTDQMPSAALSLTDLMSYTIGGIFTIGTGLMFDNIYDPTKINSGRYNEPDLSLYYTLKDGRMKLKQPFPNSGDSAYSPTDSAVDSTRLTFKGQKFLIRGSLDFGKLLSSPILSDKDLILYFESVLLGTENRPFYYKKRADRTVYTLGFNFPTFHILDLLSVEGEYCSNPYANDVSNALRLLAPVPNPTGKEYNGDNVKWTAYAQKMIYPGFSITGQIANDHMRLVDYFGHTNDVTVMPYRKNWYWAVQLGYAL